MSERAEHLHATADRQLQALIELLGVADETAMRRPCPGREKLGDGTIRAMAAHTADNYQRIAIFVATSDRASVANGSGERSRNRIPRLMRALGHQPPPDGQHGRRMHGDDRQYTAESVTAAELVERLTTARVDLERIAELPDDRLDAVPAEGSFRFCDGQRTLGQVLDGLLKHQDHQVQTLTAALAPTP